jgi:uncharacterized membrane protein
MIKKNKKQLIISSIIILLPIIAGLIMWNMLPERIATHWNVDGKANGWSGRIFAIFGLSIIMLILHWIGVFITANDPKNKEQSNKVFGMVLWISPIFSLLTSGMVYSIVLGNKINVDIAVRILLGLMFVIFGNYMPKCKQNHTIGVKVTWALRNEENWNKTHRFAGRLWVFGGVLLLATMFIPMENFMYVFFVITLFLAFAPIIYSYVYYRKQLKKGSVTKKGAVQTPWEKKFTAVSLVIGIVVLIFVGIILFTVEFEVQFGETSYTIDAAYWNNATVKYADIDNVEYREQDEPGERTLGFGSVNILMGEFENSEFGDYTRYSYTACDSCIVLTVDEKILVINGKDEESTKEIYDELTKKINE